uniref:peptidylprolyl isomerase n=1 Tax=Lotharella oceanica TaxID=641309 RepID=A0A7S2TWK4_9EUKA
MPTVATAFDKIKEEITVIRKEAAERAVKRKKEAEEAAKRAKEEKEKMDEILKTAEKIDVTPDEDKGVLKQVIKEGKPDTSPPEGMRVVAHYTGTLLDGTKFDSSRDRDSTFDFDIGQNQVIKCWDLAFATMNIGERAMLTCEPEYAYGERGSPPKIPPDATLKFDVELISWRDAYAPDAKDEL